MYTDTIYLKSDSGNLIFKENGSTYIVVGRSITGALDPVQAYKKCVKEFC